MTDRPTRMVRARDLVKGITVLWECVTARACPVPAGRHVTLDQPVTHCLTVFDVEQCTVGMSAICVSEDGEQCDFTWPAFQPLRVFADSIPEVTPVPGGD